jgi:hypothetical protein
VLARNPAAVNKRRYRRRLRAGRIVLKVEVAECDLAEALIRAGWVGAEIVLDREELAHQVGEIVLEFVSRWPRRE